MRLVVIAPDEPSGRSFGGSFDKLDIKYDIYFPKIAPRVIGEDINKGAEVARDFQKAVDFAQKHGADTIAIACNTLQLWIPQISHRARILTTFESIIKTFPDRKSRPLWLGTTPLVKNMDERKFDTLLSLNESSLQRKVQEIIWRVKAYTKADYSSAFDIENVGDRGRLIHETESLIFDLEKLSVKNVVLGCTELPIAWDLITKKSSGKINATNPAETLSRQIKSLGKLT